MELRNKDGEVTKLADNLTLKEMIEMGLTVDICDANFDPNEHWIANQKDQKTEEK